MKIHLAYVIACLAAGSSFLLNRLLLKLVGVRVIITLSPVLEETLKTLSAYFFSVDILVTHLIFGVIEAVYDWLQTNGRGIAAALLSIAGHGLFGVMTVLTAQATGIYIGLAAGIVTHLIWNTAMVRLQLQR
jgi:hypothetical protein